MQNLSSTLSKLFLFTLIALFSMAWPNVSSAAVNPKVVELLVDWNEAHNLKGGPKLLTLYDAKVVFYANEESKYDCIDKKQKFIARYPTFAQEIIPPIRVVTLANGRIILKFQKDIQLNANKKSYNAYLVLKKEGDRYRIIAESDTETDKNKSYYPDFGKIVNVELIQTLEPAAIPATNTYWYIVLAIFGISALGYTYYKNKRMGPNLAIELDSVSVPQINSTLPQQAVPQEKVVVLPEPEIDVATMGKDFESHIVKKFKKDFFTLTEWRGDKFIDGIYPESNQYPDLLFNFHFREHKAEIAIECKYRSKAEAVISIANPGQLVRYKHYQEKNNIKVYIALGVGGSPAEPAELYLIPLNALSAHEIEYHALKVYRKNASKGFYFDPETKILK